MTKGIAKGQELYGDYGDAWAEILGGVPPWSRIGRAMKQLQPLYPDAVALQARWRHYLAAEGKWASPERFAATAGLWSPPEAVPERGVAEPVIDEWGCLTITGDILTRPR